MDNLFDIDYSDTLGQMEIEENKYFLLLQR